MDTLNKFVSVKQTSFFVFDQNLDPKNFMFASEKDQKCESWGKVFKKWDVVNNRYLDHFFSKKIFFKPTSVGVKLVVPSDVQEKQRK